MSVARRCAAPCAVKLGLCGALFLFACADEEVEQAPAQEVYTKPVSPAYAHVGKSSQAPQVTFTDITRQAGIEFTHETGSGAGNLWMPETMGSGCMLFDYDGDGDEDILLVNSTSWPDHKKGRQARSLLYTNNGDGTFADVSEEAGLAFSVYGMGVSAADYDADGDTDLYLTTLGENLLLRNDGGRFADVTRRAGVGGTSWQDEEGRDHPEWSTGATWVDVDGDGWLDLFVVNYVRWSPATDLFFSFDGKEKSYATPQQYPGSTPRLYRNRGDGQFEEITEQAGVMLTHAKSMGVAVADFNGNRMMDLVVTNDTQPNFLLQNLGEGQFEELGLAAGIGYDETGRARAGMGVDITSLENDGVLVIGIGNFSREAMTLFEQQGEGQIFLDIAGPSRLVQPTLPTLTFGLRFVDYDLDGYQDLVVANGHIEPEINAVQQEVTYAQAPQLFWNDGEGRLVDVSEKTGGLFATPIVGRGLAVGDIDNDGDPDLLMTTNGGPAYLLRNERITRAGPDGSTAKSMTLTLQGRHPNPDALGAVVTVTAGDLVQTAMVKTGSSYLSQSSHSLIFGLGDRTRVDRVEVVWPDGTKEILVDIETGRHEIKAKPAE